MGGHLVVIIIGEVGVVGGGDGRTSSLLVVGVVATSVLSSRW